MKDIFKLFMIFITLTTILCSKIYANEIDFSEIDSIVKDYDSEDIDIAQFIVHVNGHLKSEIAKFKEGFQGFTENEKKQMLKEHKTKDQENDMIVKSTKDFDLIMEFYKGKNNDYYSLIFGIAPRQKAIDSAIQLAEKEYANEKIAEKQEGVDITEETEELEELNSQKEELQNIINDKEDEEIINNLNLEIQELEEEILIVKEKIDAKQRILDGQVDIDFKDFDIYEVICAERYKEDIRIRTLLEDSIKDFPRWYFNEFKKGVDNYFKLASGHEYLLHIISENKKQIKDGESCAYSKENIGVIKLDYDTGSELFKIWEKNDETFYQFYFMPSKELMRELIEKKITDPTAKTTGSQVNNKNEKINELSNKYGGSFDAIVKIVEENGNALLHKQITINPEVIISSKNISQDYENIDVTLEIDFDKLYEYMEYISKDVQGTKEKNADWSKQKNESNTKHVFGILSKGFNFWITGVKVKPVTEVPKLLFNLKQITEIFGD